MRDRSVRFRLGLIGGLTALGVSWGCANLHDVVRAKDEGSGTSAVYPVSVHQAWQITNTILELKRSNPPPREWRGDGYVLQAVQVSALSSGAFLGVWVEPVGPAQTKVTFLRKRRGAAETVHALTDREFHHDFAALLGLAGELCTVRGGPLGPSATSERISAGASTTESPDAAAPPAEVPISNANTPLAASSASVSASPVSSVAAASNLPAPSASIREVPLPPRRGSPGLPADSGLPVPRPAASGGSTSGSGIQEVPLPPRRVR